MLSRRILWLIDQALARGISGVGLKDESDRAAIEGRRDSMLP
jgi:hypothetical protein